MAGAGWYYVLECTPDTDPLMLKVGWTSRPDQRWKEHLHRWPKMSVVQMWPCHSRWERAVTVAVTRGCVLLAGGHETFGVDNREAFLGRLEAFFASHDTAANPGYTWELVFALGLWKDWRRVYGRGGTPFVPAKYRSAIGLDPPGDGD